jgi:hypothetical protein
LCRFGAGILLYGDVDLLVESLETKVVLSSSGAADHLELSQPVHVDLLKANQAVASEGMFVGSAEAYSRLKQCVDGRSLESRSSA